jgi:hypothetical protein
MRAEAENNNLRLMIFSFAKEMNVLIDFQQTWNFLSLNYTHGLLSDSAQIGGERFRKKLCGRRFAR